METKSPPVADQEAQNYHAHPDHPAKPAAPNPAPPPATAPSGTERVTPPSPDPAPESQPAASANLTQPARTRLHPGELLFGLCILLLWIGFFSAGLSIPTAELRKDLAKPELDLPTKLQYSLIVMCCYTVTNLLFLSCLAALLGSMMCRWRVREKTPVPGDGSAEERVPYDGKRLYLSAALRGFFIYLIGISGLLLFSTEAAVENTGFAQYIRLAGIISVISFAAGYEPTLSNRLMGRVTDFAHQSGGDKKS
jgi:hypothetical protein